MTLLAEGGPLATREIVEVFYTEEVGGIVVVFLVLVKELGMNAALAVAGFTTRPRRPLKEGHAMMARPVEIGLRRMAIATNFGSDSRRVGNLLGHDGRQD